MEINTSRILTIKDESQIAEARRNALHWATKANFDETTAGRFAIVVSEAASNLYKHAGGGELIISMAECGGILGLAVLALDTGRGMGNVHNSMRDGYSTAGTAGTGLGAMQRLSDEFDIYSAPGKGTVVWARIWAQQSVLKNSALNNALSLDIDGVSVPVQGETECGDGWLAKAQDQKLMVLVSDGLGHGPMAARATDEAKRIFMQRTSTSPAALLEDVHRGMRSTRGAAVAIAALDEASGRVEYCGVGNISAAIFGEKVQFMVSHNGTVGHSATKFQNFSYAWPSDASIVIYSDGLQSRLTLNGYVGLARRSTGLISGLLYRDFKRGRDDATAVTIRRRLA